MIREREKIIRDAENTVRKAEENFQNTNRLENKTEQTCNQILNTISIKQKECDKYKAMITEVVQL